MNSATAYHVQQVRVHDSKRCCEYRGGILHGAIRGTVSRHTWPPQAEKSFSWQHVVAIDSAKTILAAAAILTRWRELRLSVSRNEVRLLVAHSTVNARSGGTLVNVLRTNDGSSQSQDRQKVQPWGGRQMFNVLPGSGHHRSHQCSCTNMCRCFRCRLHHSGKDQIHTRRYPGRTPCHRSPEDRCT